MPSSIHLWFRVRWWSANVLLALTRGSCSDSEAWAYSVRQYLKGFSGAVVPAARAPEQQLEAILRWRNSGPTHPVAAHPAERSARDQKTVNDRRLKATASCDCHQRVLRGAPHSGRTPYAKARTNPYAAATLYHRHGLPSSSRQSAPLGVIDRRFGVPQFHLCKYLLRAEAAFFRTPGIK